MNTSIIIFSYYFKIFFRVVLPRPEKLVEIIVVKLIAVALRRKYDVLAPSFFTIYLKFAKWEETKAR